MLIVSSTEGSLIINRLKAAFECCVFFDMFAIFVERRCTDGVEFTAREHRLEHVGGVHRTFGCPCHRRGGAFRQ